MTTQKTYLCFDISNMLYRGFFSQHNETEEVIAGLAVHMALTTLNKYFNKFKPHAVAMGFDRKSWRKTYTASEQCISKKPYKGNRRQDMTPAQTLKYERFIAHVKEFESIMIAHTNIIPLYGDNLEADDAIAGFCERVSSEGDKVIVISTDSDLLQLTRYPGISVVSPATDKEQSLSEYDDDPLLYLFIKCVRGDSTDNVQSAYPRVRKDRLKKAYSDTFEYTKLMNESWTLRPGEDITVQQLFKENELLIDLSKQPADIRDQIETAVTNGLTAPKRFSMFHLMKFCAKLKLTKVIQGMDAYIPLLSRR
jgi:hypothetical protein